MKFTNLLALGALMACASATPTANQERGSAIGSSNGASKYLAKSLPQVNFPVPRSWAGNIEIGGKYGNDSLFFWLWQAESSKNREDLIIWVNSGPACSGQAGALKTHGPVIFPGTSPTPQPNPYAWTKAANILYLDERVTAGFSIGTRSNPLDPADVLAATVQWLKSFFAQFPELKSNKIHFMGESFAGTFLPPVVEALQAESKALGLRVVSVSVGNAVVGNAVAQADATLTRYLDAHRNDCYTRISDQLLNVYKLADVNCGYKTITDKLLTFPPSIRPTSYPVHRYNNYKIKRRQLSLPQYPVPEGWNQTSCTIPITTPLTPEALAFVIYQSGERCYDECAMQDSYQGVYLFFQQNGEPTVKLNGYKVDETVNYNIGGPYYNDAWVAWLNRVDVQTAIHAPKIEYSPCNFDILSILVSQNPEPPAYRVFPSLLSKGIKVNIYSGDLDFVLPSPGALPHYLAYKTVTSTRPY